MFELEKTKAKLTQINPRIQKRGKEDVPAADIFVQISTGCEILSEFAPSLRSFLFVEDESEGQLEGVETLRKLRFGSLIQHVSLNHKLTGADVTIGFGVGGVSDIELSTVDVDRFTAEPMEGGSVLLRFRVKALPTGADISRLHEVLGGEIDITVTPPVDPQGSLPGVDDD